MPVAVRFGLCLSVGLFASCAAPQVGGTYRLPVSDTREIQHVLLWTIGIPKPILEISGDDSTHAHALTGTTNQWGSTIYLVRLEKKDGVWRVLSKKLAIVTQT